MTDWSALPRGVEAALRALNFSHAEAFPKLGDAEWETALAFCDRAHLTLYLGTANSLPDWVAERIERKLENNRLRMHNLLRLWDRVAKALVSAGVEFVVLKGFSHWGTYCPEPERRLQYDLDLFVPWGAEAARDALLELGYESIGGKNRNPTDHLPALVQHTRWHWTGNYFDPRIPYSIELHFRLWDTLTEAFAAPGIEEFWHRRVCAEVAGRPYMALAEIDRLGYAALHILRHLLRGDARAGQVYELACFLHARSTDHAFWAEWLARHPVKLRRLESIAFRLAEEWFGCMLHLAVRDAADALPGSARGWLSRWSASPVESAFRPNKDELALHLALVDSLRGKAAVIRRRLLPGRLPGVPAGVGGRARYTLSRGLFHCRTVVPALSTMLSTWLR